MAEKKKGKVASFFAEFKTFAIRGNVIDLAIGVIIGSTFSKIVSELVDSILMPFLSLLTGGINISGLTIHIDSFWDGQAGVDLLVGQLLQTIISFIFIVFCLFILVRVINRLRKPAVEEQAPPAPTQEQLLTEIRDLLAQQKQ